MNRFFNDMRLSRVNRIELKHKSTQTELREDKKMNHPKRSTSLSNISNEFIEIIPIKAKANDKQVTKKINFSRKSHSMKQFKPKMDINKLTKPKSLQNNQETRFLLSKSTSSLSSSSSCSQFKPKKNYSSKSRYKIRSCLQNKRYKSCRNKNINNNNSCNRDELSLIEKLCNIFNCFSN